MLTAHAAEEADPPPRLDGPQTVTAAFSVTNAADLNSDTSGALEANLLTVSGSPTNSLSYSNASSVTGTASDAATPVPSALTNTPPGRIRSDEPGTIRDLVREENLDQPILLQGTLHLVRNFEDNKPYAVLEDATDEIGISFKTNNPLEGPFLQELLTADQVSVRGTLLRLAPTELETPSFYVEVEDPTDLIPLRTPDYNLILLSAAFLLVLTGTIYLWRQRRLAELHALELQSATENLKRSQEALRQSEERFRRAFEDGPVGIILASPDSRVLRANRTLCSMLGYSEEELLGLGLMDLGHEADTQSLCRQANLLFNGEIPSYRVEQRFLRKDRNIIWVRITATLLTSSDGQPLYALSIVEDITERKAWEESLRQSEERFSKAFHASPVPISLATLNEGKFIDVNESFLHLVGYKREELIGKTALELHIWPSPDVREEFIVQLMEKQGSRRNVEGTVCTKSGDTRECLGGAELIELNGEKCILCLIHDFTEHKRALEALRQSEERFQLIAHATNDTVWDWDLVTNRIWWNEGIKTLFGYSPDQSASDANWWDEHIHAEDRSRILRSMEEVIESGGHSWSAEYRYRRANGSYADVFDRAYVIHDHTGKPIRMIGAMMDITERKRFEKELSKARDEALASARLKSEFLANISHEVRTPLNGIVGMTVLLQDTPLSSDQDNYVDTIKSSSEALLTIINDILDFSKMEAGKLELEALDFDLRNTVENTVELLAEQADNKRIELVSLINADVPTRLRGDPGRLRQVITNLLANGIKFTKEGEVVLTVSVDNVSDAHVVLLFKVRDTGIGIKAEAVPLLFQAFSQADGSTTRRYGGTGLGLAISRQIIELMGGEIGVDSAPGKGSTFWFTIRLEKQRPDDTSGFGKPTALAGLRVLIADDNKASRDLLAEYTTRLGMKPTRVASGQETLNTLRDGVARGEAYTLALIDLQMPDMDGIVLSRAIKADPRIAHTGLLLMASRGTRGDTSTLKTAGIGAYLIKPVRLQQLIDRLLALATPTPQHETRFWLDRRNRRTPSPKPGPKPPKGALHILVAEDNPINQRVAVALLNKLGYTAQAVATGKEVLESVRNVSYDVVFMDCQLPEIDGFETTRRIREYESTLPDSHERIYVIAMTALAQPGIKDRCLDAGMDDYLSKPVRIESLIEVLRRATNQDPEQGSASADQAPTSPPNDSIHAPTLDALKALRAPGVPDPLEELIDMFLKETPAQITRMKQAAARYDARTLSKESHALRGSASTIGALTLSDLCGDIEDNAEARRLQEASHLISNVKKEFGRVREYLDYEKALSPTISPSTDSESKNP